MSFFISSTSHKIFSLHCHCVQVKQLVCVCYSKWDSVLQIPYTIWQPLSKLSAKFENLPAGCLPYVHSQFNQCRIRQMDKKINHLYESSSLLVTHLNSFFFIFQTKSILFPTSLLIQLVLTECGLLLTILTLQAGFTLISHECSCYQINKDH